VLDVLDCLKILNQANCTKSNGLRCKHAETAFVTGGASKNVRPILLLRNISNSRPDISEDEPVR
jgi:hypothetical protein